MTFQCVWFDLFVYSRLIYCVILCCPLNSSFSCILYLVVCTFYYCWQFAPKQCYLFHDSELLSGPLDYQTLKETLGTCNSFFIVSRYIMFCDPYEVITDFWISYLFFTQNLPYLHFEIYIENVYKKAIHFAITNWKYTHTYGIVFPIYL